MKGLDLRGFQTVVSRVLLKLILVVSTTVTKHNGLVVVDRLEPLLGATVVLEDGCVKLILLKPFISGGF